MTKYILSGKKVGIERTDNGTGYMCWQCPDYPDLYVKVIKATPNWPTDHVLVTLEIRMHRWVLAEFNTHRKFSRNSASSRAIPVVRRLKAVEDNPAVPVIWAAEQKGMQGGEEIHPLSVGRVESIWQHAARDAMRHACSLASAGVHKSIVNRLLEPFLYHTAIVSATDWSGFLNQRVSPLAQPEIQIVAKLIEMALAEVEDEMEQSRRSLVQVGNSTTSLFGWHMPYIDYDSDYGALSEAKAASPDSRLDAHHLLYDSSTALLARVSAARCARVSYLTQDGKRDVVADLKLYKRLTESKPMHASPLEHIALKVGYDQASAWPGNFDGFVQLRHFVELGVDPFK